MTVTTEARSALERSAEMEMHIARYNAEIANCRAPKSANDLAQIVAAKEFATLQRERLIAKLVDLEQDVLREQCVEAQAAYNRSSQAVQSLAIEQREIEIRLEQIVREIAYARQRARPDLENVQRLNNAIVTLQSAGSSSPLRERDAKTITDALRQRLLDL